MMQPADVAEAELVGDLVDGLEVGLEDRLLHVLRALADEAAGVHVDRGERLGLIDDEVAADGSGTLRASARPISSSMP
jgi:hypothetical protein